ncbi:SIS domain-containing protein [Candidatus Gracilibacteria bacterium]|nr:SIS domain-containing protein [Candidatus Gracilibacteria bacterium]
MENLNRYLSQMSLTLQQLPREPLADISHAIWETYLRDSTIIVCGNGGSAATASHFACDLAKWTLRPNARRVRALALTDNIPLMTAWSNDASYADVFLEQLITHYRPGDMVFAISGSGNSANVLRAVDWANHCGANTVGITGFDGGKLARLARIALRVDNYVMPQVEDVHSTICHALAVNLGLQIEQSVLEGAAHTAPVLVEVPQRVYLERAIGD